jgi:DNA processing protein
MDNGMTALDYLCLSLIPGLGPAGALRLLAHFGTADRVLQATVKEQAAVDGLRAGQVQGFAHAADCRRQAEQHLEAIVALGGCVVTFADDLYPERLRQLPDPPLVLFALGDPGLLAADSVAIVGSRSATSYGRRAAWLLAENLAEHAVCVVSGMALGIDSEAHCGALKRGGATVAILGSGLDVVYPPQNRPLYNEIRDKGLLLSEYPPGTRPDGFRFPARNRLIAGLSLGVVVVEAARRSGSLITAQLALDYGREIFAVPGQIDSCKSEGSHWLLQQGAKLVTSGRDILDELRYGASAIEAAPRVPVGQVAAASELDSDAAFLLDLLEPYPMTRDEVSDRAGLNPARLSEIFLFLELEGYIELLAGDRVRRRA